MKEKREIMQEGKSQNAKLKMTFAILFLAILFIVELYLMMNYPKEYIFMGVAGLGILCLVYIVTDLSFKIKQERESAYEKEYESIYKAQKVSYVFMKQSFMDMEEVLDRIKANSEVPADELIEAQKAVGKITIKKNRENTASVLNSNEKVINQITSFEKNMKDIIRSMEESISNHSPEVSGGQQDIIQNLEKNQAMLREEINRLKEQIDLKNLEILDVIKKSISENAAMLEKRISSEISVQVKENSVSAEMIAGKLKETMVPEETVISGNDMGYEAAVPEKNITVEENAVLDPIMPEVTVAVEEKIVSESVIPETPITEEEKIVSEPVILETPITAEEKIVSEPIIPETSITEEEKTVSEPIILEEPVTVEENTVSESIMLEEPITAEETVVSESVIPEEIVTIEESLIPEPKVLEETAAVEENTVSEPIMLEEPITAEEIVIPEPVIPEIEVPESKETLEEIASSGKIMTPEEIASLLEETDAAMEVQEPVKEEKAAAPDVSSDPGHVMTPEEIAALLENIIV